MATVMEGPFAHARPVIAADDIIIGLSPAECLSGCDNCSLISLVVVTQLSVLAPTRLVLALSAVV